MNKKLITSLITIVAMVMVATVFINCGKKEPSTEDRYKAMIEEEFQTMAARHNANSRYLIIVDYSIPSNQDRLFIWDTEQNAIVEKFWCAHGFGGNSTPEKPEFSNVLGSNCSSLGWFLVDKGVGKSPRYGYYYHAVEGLDATNSNARERQILIHQWISVTTDCKNKIEHPMDLDMRCAGCFTTTEDGYDTIDRYAKSSQKRLLLWAINGTK